MKSYVLDSYAVLTYFQNEKGADQVEEMLRDAVQGKVTLFLSTVNLGGLSTSPSGRWRRRQAQTSLGAGSAPSYSNRCRLRSLCWRQGSKQNMPFLSPTVCPRPGLQSGGAVITGDPEFKKAEKIAPSSGSRKNLSKSPNHLFILGSNSN